MGSIIAKDCVHLEDLSQEIFAEYETTAYTVVKPDDSNESGWCISRTPHRCIFNREGWQAAHAVIIDGEWRVFLYHNTFPDFDTHTPLDSDAFYDETGTKIIEHSCGWRRVGTFWPTLLTGDNIGIGQWQTTLLQRLTDLQSRKLSEATDFSSPSSPYSPLP